MIPSCAAVFAAALALVSAAQANPHEFSLPNGLRLIVKEDHRAPTVVHQVWYRVGSMDEVPGVTGVAHVLEHMMFKGTRRFGPGEFSRIIAEAGGRENAFTSTDFTVYHEQIHRDRLPLAMRLEADRMVNLVVRPEEFAQEIKVGMEGRRLSYEDRPRSLLYENLLATALAAHLQRRRGGRRVGEDDGDPAAISRTGGGRGGSAGGGLNGFRGRGGGAATSADADYELISRGPGMLFLGAAAAKGRSASELEDGMREIVARVAAEGISPEELARAKVQRLSELVFRRDSFFAQALELGELESVGLSFRGADRIAERFKAITVEQVRAAAARYLVEDGLTVAVLDPQPLNPRSAGAAPPAAKH